MILFLILERQMRLLQVREPCLRPTLAPVIAQRVGDAPALGHDRAVLLGVGELGHGRHGILDRLVVVAALQNAEERAEHRRVVRQGHLKRRTAREPEEEEGGTHCLVLV